MKITKDGDCLIPPKNISHILRRRGSSPVFILDFIYEYVYGVQLEDQYVQTTCGKFCWNPNHFKLKKIKHRDSNELVHKKHNLTVKKIAFIKSQRYFSGLHKLLERYFNLPRGEARDIRLEKKYQNVPPNPHLDVSNRLAEDLTPKEFQALLDSVTPQ